MVGLPCGHGGVSYPLGGWLCPADLTRAALKEAQASGLLRLEYHTPVSTITELADGWQVESQDGRQWLAPNLVVAAGHRLPALLPFAELPLYPVRGQVSHVPTTARLSQLRTVLCYDGYLTPAHDGAHCIGASYGRNQSTLAYSAEEQAQNQARLQACLPDQSWPAEVDVSGKEARVGVRCASRDHLPVAGPIARLASLADHDPKAPADQQSALPLHAGLYVLGALGSRGLCSAPLCGELVASEICGDPLPLAADLLEALQAMGIRILLDDFGTGFTSIHYLRTYGFSHVKIDKSLLANLSPDSKASLLVAGAINLARGLDMEVTAEGVETQEQAALLRAAGCNKLQGFLFGRPMAIADLKARCNAAQQEQLTPPRAQGLRATGS